MAPSRRKRKTAEQKRSDHIRIGSCWRTVQGQRVRVVAHGGTTVGIEYLTESRSQNPYECEVESSGRLSIKHLAKEMKMLNWTSFLNLPVHQREHRDYTRPVPEYNNFPRVVSCRKCSERVETSYLFFACQEKACGAVYHERCLRTGDCDDKDAEGRLVLIERNGSVFRVERPGNQETKVTCWECFIPIRSSADDYTPELSDAVLIRLPVDCGTRKVRTKGIMDQGSTLSLPVSNNNSYAFHFESDGNWESERNAATYTLFSDAVFRNHLSMLKGKNESRDLQDLSSLLVHSAEALANMGVRLER